MADFTITDSSNDQLVIDSCAEDGAVMRVWLKRKTNGMPYVRVTAAQAPALALAILEAAGIEPKYHPKYQITPDSRKGLERAAFEIEAHSLYAAETAKEAEAVAARDKRRDELAREFTTEDSGLSWDYLRTSIGTRRAIDRIIELENAANGS